jgi:hypothetical protein
MITSFNRAFQKEIQASGLGVPLVLGPERADSGRGESALR